MKFITQIELTNICNRRCKFCGQVNMTRTKGCMSESTLLRCLTVMQGLGQETVGLNHYGESTLHPQFLDFAWICNDFGVKPWLYTNGDLITEEFLAKMALIDWHKLVISNHAPVERRLELQKLCIQHGIPVEVQMIPEEGMLSIAGQVPVDGAGDAGMAPLVDPSNHCGFLTRETACVLWNGDLAPCCFSYNGTEVFGNIHDEHVLDLKSPVWPLCSQCPGHPSNIV